MRNIQANSLEEALLFLTQSARAGEGGDPRAADWMARAMMIIAKHVEIRDPNAGTTSALVPQLLVQLGGRLPRGDQYLKEEEVRNGWLHYEHSDGRQAICRDGQATFAHASPGWYRTGPMIISEGCDHE